MLMLSALFICFELLLLVGSKNVSLKSRLNNEGSADALWNKQFLIKSVKPNGNCISINDDSWLAQRSCSTSTINKILQYDDYENKNVFSLWQFQMIGSCKFFVVSSAMIRFEKPYGVFDVHEKSKSQGKPIKAHELTRGQNQQWYFVKCDNKGYRGEFVI